MNATFEVIERDLFLCHYHSSETWLDVTDVACRNDGYVKQIREDLIGNGFELRIGELFSSNQMYCAVSAVFNKSGGVVVGLSCKKTMQHAVRKSMFEAVANAVISNKNPRILELNDFLSLPYEESVDTLKHQHLGLSSSSGDYIRKLFSNSRNYVASSFHESDFVGEEISLPGFLEESGLVCVWVRNYKLQQLYFGNNVIDNLNVGRLNEFSPDNAINYRPHILG